MAQPRKKLRHLLVPNTSVAEPYASPVMGGGKPRLPPVERARHGEQLLEQLERARQELQSRDADRDVVAFEARRGLYLEFASAPGFELALDRLDLPSAGIELVAKRDVGPVTYATVYVPEGQVAQFTKRVEEYTSEDSKSGKPKHQPLVESIHEIRLAVLEGFWTDDPALFPPTKKAIWWEVWLRDDRSGTLERFNGFAGMSNIRVGERHLRFPERIVVLAWGTREQMAGSVEILDVIAELRLAKEVPASFAEMPAPEQAAWVKDLSRRITPPPPDGPAVCILDTGVNRAHPLLVLALAEGNLHAYNPEWGLSDHHGHGTEMAGIALYGDLAQILPSSTPVSLTHQLESVKILPPQGRNDPDLYGVVTAESVARVEVAAPTRNRAFSMAVATTEFRDRGQPSSWSAEIDRLSSGADDEPRRLFLICAGNRTGNNIGPSFRSGNETEGIHDPGQSWNAITVGAYTERFQIDDPSLAGWTPVAAPGDLSPSSTTSCIWKGQWPRKPDIVMEGGNMALSPNRKEAYQVDSLALLTTHSRPQEKLLATTDGTSAATAGAARLAAAIWAEYPSFWPETIRALLVHSAQWTEAMKKELREAKKKKGHEFEHLLRCYGFGVPNRERALWSAKNAATLVIQDRLQPFDRDSTKEMHLHTLPWPKEALADLGEEKVQLCITLSYFIEPNPARRGWVRRHRYASHGLRFAVSKPTESKDEFRKRVNKAARAEEDGKISTSDRGWFLGTDLRNKGSLHQDYWIGTAADLASRDILAVYPVTGWWRERPHLERWSQAARYALVVSIRTRAQTVDIYEPIANQVEVKTGIPV
ncbi:S8 family peptidase [Polyangium fumosum]|uniref:S8 family peptidase n=1 Tax=Polyangium fumosum TaxID=889272 RepID=A0A4U1IS84_9BACT|nr:S8 family peptidase [Polyangium fumosum]TKC97101.1 S8 family peptidase [Polyangium fumosum]